MRKAEQYDIVVQNSAVSHLNNNLMTSCCARLCQDGAANTSDLSL